MTKGFLKKLNAIPTILERTHDVVLAAETGGGKTLAYLLPLLQLLKHEEVHHKVEMREKRPRALILVPNRELATQIRVLLLFIFSHFLIEYLFFHLLKTVAKKLSHFFKFRSTYVVGGESMRDQKLDLSSKLDVLVATPGRLLEHFDESLLKFQFIPIQLLIIHFFFLENIFFTDVRYVVIDEADTMFDKDFYNMLEKIFLPIKNRKSDLPNFLYPTRFTISTATLTPKLNQIIEKNFSGIRKVSSGALHKVLRTLKQTFIPVPSGDKFRIQKHKNFKTNELSQH